MTEIEATVLFSDFAGTPRKHHERLKRYTYWLQLLYVFFVDLHAVSNVFDAVDNSSTATSVLHAVHP